VKPFHNKQETEELLLILWDGSTTKVLIPLAGASL